MKQRVTLGITLLSTYEYIPIYVQIVGNLVWSFCWFRVIFRVVSTFDVM